MKYWQIKVRCGCLKRGGQTAEESMLTVVIKADDMDSAMRAGEQYAEAISAFGPRWVYFKAEECGRFIIPFVLEKPKVTGRFKAADLQDVLKERMQQDQAGEPHGT